MRLNVGCGDHFAEGWYNMDIHHDSKAECLGDIITLSLPAASVESVYLGHVLEHLAYEDAILAVRNVWRMLEPGGTVGAVGPDLDKVNQLEDPLLWEMLHKGGDDRRKDVYMQHKWGCTEGTLLALMTTSFPDAQPMNLTVVGAHFPLVSLVHWQCAVVARKPAW